MTIRELFGYALLIVLLATVAMVWWRRRQKLRRHHIRVWGTPHPHKARQRAAD